MQNTERKKVSGAMSEESNLDEQTLKLPVKETEMRLTRGSQPALSGELSSRLSEGILQSMDSLNKAADKLTSSMEESIDVSEIIGYAESLAKTVQTQANMVKSVAEAMRLLGFNEKNK